MSAWLLPRLADLARVRRVAQRLANPIQQQRLAHTAVQSTDREIRWSREGVAFSLGTLMAFAPFLATCLGTSDEAGMRPSWCGLYRQPSG